MLFPVGAFICFQDQSFKGGELHMKISAYFFETGESEYEVKYFILIRRSENL
jgi:hypothetical protein